MRKFVLNNSNDKKDISEYVPEYAGKIYCEDPQCRVPIFLVPGNIMPSHFRVMGSYKHHKDCYAKSKKNENPRKKKVNSIEGVPVFNLSDKVEREPIDGGININVGGKKNGGKKGGNDKGETTTIKREYLRDVSQIGRYISRDFLNRYDLPISLGQEEKKIFSVIYDLDRLVEEKDTLNEKEVVVLGQVHASKVTEKGNHFSIYISDGQNNKIRIYANSKIASQIKSKIKSDRCILVRGNYSSEFSGQIVLNKVSDVYLFKKGCLIY